MTPKARQILYVAGVLAFAVLTLLSATRVIDGQTAASVSAALTAVLGLFGVTISGTAAYNVTKQVHNGQFADVSPADQVVHGINAVLAQAEQAKSEVERVREAVSSAVAEVPVLGPLAQQAIDSLPKI
jgi:hypothetical protein